MTKLRAGAFVMTLQLLTAAAAQAADFQVTMINLTRGIYYTPLLVAAHEPHVSLFTSGEAASTSLQALAEGGDLDQAQADDKKSQCEGQTSHEQARTSGLEGLLGAAQFTSLPVYLPCLLRSKVKH